MRISDWSSDVCSSDLFGGEQVGDLVCLHAVVEGGDLEAELLRQVDHRRHLVGAVAVDVHEDVAVEHAGQRFQLEVALVVLVVFATALRALVSVRGRVRSDKHTTALQSLMRISYAVCCVKNKNN